MLNFRALPVEGGTRPQGTVTISLHDLRHAGAGLLEFGDGPARGVIRAEDARRLACDAGVIPVLLGSGGQPFDVGRKHRVVPHALRRALAARDGGCAFPGCGMPAQWCEGHHLRPWVDGGETSLGNTVLLCARHHRLIHRGEWTVTVDGGIPSFPPPWWSGGPPGRNVVHRPDLLGRPPAPCRPVEQVSLDDLVALPQPS
ncbi:hypothetical protein GCM10023215_38910 [Pseudonocardia yuanmonensis]|uniref:HNH nuclease domain-containing protein n=1 Tax=Pseudonocardia yuanmonensis TaxID=1095914 RepID=A0ABP8WXN5_9PSEU